MVNTQACSSCCECVDAKFTGMQIVRENDRIPLLWIGTDVELHTAIQWSISGPQTLGGDQRIGLAT